LPIPEVKALITDKASGKTLASAEGGPLNLKRSKSSSGYPISEITSFTQEIQDDGIKYISTARFLTPISEEKLKELVQEGYEESVKESDGLEVYARVAIGVNWGPDKSTIQIQRGTFEVSQSNPLVSYSNAFYGMMQKANYTSNTFNGKSLTIETGWPVDNFDAQVDAYTCGGAVGGEAMNFLTGEVFNFTFEIYF
jgi:hypothetical protein